MRVICSWCQRLVREQEGEGISHTLCSECKPFVASGSEVGPLLKVGDLVRYCGRELEVTGLERSTNGLADGGQSLGSLLWSEVDDRLIIDLADNHWLAGDQVERIPFKDGVQT